MRFLLVVSALLAATSSVDAFAPSQRVAFSSSTALQSAVAADAASIKARLDAQLEKMKAKDSASKALSKEDLKIVFEDEHIVIVDKPAGVLCVPGKEDNPSLSQAVFDAFGSESGRADKMVVHRLGMDTSGLVVFARTNAALSGMNTLFRTRKVIRKYEALVCGTVEADEGVVNKPLMRDYEFPPFMRVSTEEHQQALVGLDAAEVGKKMLELPKDSLTKYEVASREELSGNAVSRLSLTSISGRTHQLNVHCAAFGHPIVGDKVYGIDGEAAANGGLDDASMDENSNRATEQLQKDIAADVGDKPMCVHAKSLSFDHPITRETLTFESGAPF
uniref:Pseudouridine synthase RsuA/RluA-like domain-containing protein n=1 Tax=Eucampia antarctica TaxID=49252 RepID=A0A7S2RV37_9STRA|mmetsp:Transcript_2727/g.2621  ORF Transcript_2727/g.2621 Transcript_2727/m.2621 type:complete len:333 (+) Transcript_2727:115-1113(+)